MKTNAQQHSVLKTAREAKGLLQADVARLSGISRPAICLIEAGKRNPSPRVAKALAEVLGVPVTSILYPEAQA